jgi:hypothetical protein
LYNREKSPPIKKNLQIKEEEARRPMSWNLNIGGSYRIIWDGIDVPGDQGKIELTANRYQPRKKM